MIQGIQTIDIDRENFNVVDEVYNLNPYVHNDCNDQNFINEKEMNFQYIEDDYFDYPYNSFHSIEIVMSMTQRRDEHEGNNGKRKFSKKLVKKGLR